jgi:cytochrome c-type biogenesis protein CcmF
VSLAVFIATATTWPRISEWLLDQKSTLGPTFYNTVDPADRARVFALMGVAPLLGWRKTSARAVQEELPLAARRDGCRRRLHLAFGKSLGFPAFVTVDPIYPGALGDALANLGGTYPFVTVALCAFNVRSWCRSSQRGIAARQKKGERACSPLFLLVAQARAPLRRLRRARRHRVMFLGFAGRAWGVDKEISLSPGEKVQIEEYKLTYVGPRMEVDEEKRMVFADVDVLRHGKPVGRLSPAKFIYKATPGPALHRGRAHITAAQRPLRHHRHGQPRDQGRLVPDPREPAGLVHLARGAGPDPRRDHIHVARREPAGGRRLELRTREAPATTESLAAPSP